VLAAGADRSFGTRGRAWPGSSNARANPALSANVLPKKNRAYYTHTQRIGRERSCNLCLLRHLPTRPLNAYEYLLYAMWRELERADRLLAPQGMTTRSLRYNCCIRLLNSTSSNQEIDPSDSEPVL